MSKNRRGGSQYYARGANMERAFVKWLRAKGWVAVRSAGSRGSFDVLAAQRGRVILAQLKRDGKISDQETFDLLQDAEIAGATALLVCKPARGQEFEAKILLKGGYTGELYF
jgi:Holliday junction resolvase